MSKSMDNAQVIGDFRARWKLHYKSSFMFRADVVYISDRAPQLSGEYEIGLQISGMEANTITFLANDDELDGDLYHLGFGPAWQTYALDPVPGTLIITGKSDKMGKYRCEITPLL